MPSAAPKGKAHAFRCGCHCADLARHNTSTFQTRISAWLLLAGEFDYLLKMRVKDVDAFSRMHVKTRLKLPGVRQLRSFFVLNECKIDAPMPLD
ncbi:Lrp/AsnC ligand binding domain-containing protein [Undibacterium terreum]|uniref:Lrp/AsnC ligand binding domain-containing protein n=1 Tax=Undibacterium terreum TaxID=1224302 RepID=UPI00227A0DC1|nr:Lrp/AsnC ligand binding domain-containing protein [Undibacterium terreum]